MMCRDSTKRIVTAIYENVLVFEKNYKALLIHTKFHLNLFSRYGYEKEQTNPHRNTHTLFQSFTFIKILSFILYILI